MALAIMAVLAGLAWRGVDGMLRTRAASQQAVENTARLNTLLAQWQQDLSSVLDTGLVPALNFDGQSLLLTRRNDQGVVLVAWALRSGTWQRWVSPPVLRAQALQEQWLRAQQLQGSEPEQLTLLEGVDTWQLYYFRDNAWSNAQSSAGTLQGGGALPAPPGNPASAATPTRTALPTGVRLLLTVNGQPLTRDIALAP